VVRSPKSGVNFFSLGDFEEQLEMACVRAQPAINQVMRPHLSVLLCFAESACPLFQLRQSGADLHLNTLHQGAAFSCNIKAL